MPVTADHFVPSYWLLGDDQLALSMDRTRADFFVANFKHSLLFNPSLLFSDSMAINNSNFRHLVRDDPSFRELLNDATFSLAIRDNAAGLPRDLIEVKQELARENKYRLQSFHDEDDETLTFLKRHAEIIPYSIARVSEIYSEESIALFQTDRIRRSLPAGLCDQIFELAVEGREKPDSVFGRDFFAYQLEPLLQRKRPDLPVHDLMGDIRMLAGLPYVTALPKAIHASPIYATKHAEAFELCGGRGELVSCGERDIHSIRLTTGLVEFARGLALLSSETILELRQTAEARAYFEARNEFGIEKFEHSKRDFVLSLSNYVRRIEDKILKGARQPFSDDVLSVEFDVKERRLRSSLLKGMDQLSDLYTYIGVAAALVSTLSGFQFVLPEILGLLLVKPVLRLASTAAFGTSHDEQTETERNLRSAQVEFLNSEWSGDERIGTKLTTFSSPQAYAPTETLYTSPNIS